MSQILGAAGGGVRQAAPPTGYGATPTNQPPGSLDYGGGYGDSYAGGTTLDVLGAPSSRSRIVGLPPATITVSRVHVETLLLPTPTIQVSRAHVEVLLLLSTYTGTATGAHTSGGTAAGAVDRSSSGTGAHTSGGTADGVVGTATSATGVHTLGGTAAGATGTSSAADTATHTTGATADGTISTASAASGVHITNADAAGVVATFSDATGAHTADGATTGSTGTSTGATGAHTAGGSADGVAAAGPGSDADATHTSGGTADGVVGTATGATGAHTSGGTADGVAGVSSAATGAHTSGGTATGATGLSRGATTGTHTAGGTTAGTVAAGSPASGATGAHHAGGSASGEVTYTPRTVRDWSGGRVRDGSAVAFWEPPVIPIPPGVLVDNMTVCVIDSVDVDDTTGAVTLTQRTLTRRRAYHRLLIDNKDFTVWRGGVTPPVTYALQEPLLYGAGKLTLPQVDALYEVAGRGTLRRIRKHVEVVQQRVDPDTGVVLGTDYVGFISDYDHSGPDFSATLGGQAAGRLELAIRPPVPFPKIVDIGRLIVVSVRRVYLAAKDPPVTGVRSSESGGGGSELDYVLNLTANSTQKDGTQWTVMPDAQHRYRVKKKDGETIDFTVYFDDELIVPALTRDHAVEPDVVWATAVGTDGRRINNTVMPGLSVGPRPQYPMDDHTVVLHPGTTDADTDTGGGITRLAYRLWETNRLDTLGQHVWTTDPDDPITEAIRGVQDDADLHVTGNLNLATWRALWDQDVNPYTLRGARIMPFARRPWVPKWRTDASGQRIGRNPRWVRSRIPVHASYDMGAGFKRRQIVRWAKRVLSDDDPNWLGTFTVNGAGVIRGEHNPGDPFDVSMLMDVRELRPGMNAWAPTWQGQVIDGVWVPGTLLHVTGIDVDEEGIPRVTVDTRMRDQLAVWEQITRNRESRKSPARLYIAQNRSSTQTKDSGGLWDNIGGRIAPVDCQGDAWTYFEVPAGREGQARNLHLQTDPPSEYAVAFFGRNINRHVLHHRIGNPLSADGKRAWRRHQHVLTRNYWLNYSAGTEDNPCGYSPSTKADVLQDLPWRVTFTDGHYRIFESEARANKAAEGHDGAHVAQFGDPTNYVTGEWEDLMTWPYFCVGEPVLRGMIYTDRNTTLQGGRIMTLALDDQV
jgi:hypothetical protein